MKRLSIAIDFDGTIAEDCYPNPPIRFIDGAKCAILKLQEYHTLLMWTPRRGPEYHDAKEFLRRNGIALSDSLMFGSTQWVKPPVDMFIDDKNVGGFIGWDRVLLEVEKIMKFSR